MTHFDFSSDLDMGGPPELKFDEKSKCIILFIKLLSSEDLFTAEKVLHLSGASPPGLRVQHVFTRVSPGYKVAGAFPSDGERT